MQAQHILLLKYCWSVKQTVSCQVCCHACCCGAPSSDAFTVMDVSSIDSTAPASRTRLLTYCASISRFTKGAGAEASKPVIVQTCTLLNSKSLCTLQSAALTIDLRPKHAVSLYAEPAHHAAKRQHPLIDMPRKSACRARRYGSSRQQVWKWLVSHPGVKRYLEHPRCDRHTAH